MKYDIEKYTQEKKSAESKIIIGIVGLIIGGLVFFLVPDLIAAGIIALVIGGIFIAIGGTKFKDVSHRFKSEVLVDLVSELVDDGVFNPHQGLSINQVYQTEFLKHADRYHTEDFLSGSIEGVRFVSSDVKLEERHVRHTKNGTQETWETFFLGRVFIFDFNKSFDGYLQVLESGRPQVNRRYNKVKLESVAFNKKFKTFATNDHSAFYVLTPHFMEALMDFEKNNRGSIKFSFIDNYLYIGIDNRKDTFELRLFTPITEETFAEFERDLHVVKEVVTELKLNNRIFK